MGEIEINGVKYRPADPPPKPKGYRGYGKLYSIMAMGMMFGGQGMVGTSKEPDRPNVDIVKEYELIQNRKSLLSKSQRDWVEYMFNKSYTRID